VSAAFWRSGSGSGSLELRELEPARFAPVWELMRAGVAEGVAPGMVAGLWDAREPDVAWVAAVGKRRVFPLGLPSQPMTLDTIFDLASLTKVMATATLAAALVDRGWISWRTPLAAILPRASTGGAPTVTLAHLLSHTAGYAAWAPFWERMRERFGGEPLTRFSVAERQRAMRELVFAIAPETAPGARAVYSDISFLLLGFALEEVTGLPLDRAVRRFVWGPMGIETAFFRRVTEDPVRARLEQVAATEESPWRGGMLQGQVHDDNCWSMGGYGGHAGAFGSVRDVLHFARALYPAWSGTHAGPVGARRGFLSSPTLRAAWTRVTAPVGCERTLGWDTPSGPDSSAGRYFSAQTVGHLGFTGTSLWIDTRAGLAVTLLTNRVHPTRENTLIRAFRPKFHDAIRATALF
jgi:CubicO group peptidase (beta-lactamase class C family)